MRKLLLLVLGIFALLGLLAVIRGFVSPTGTITLLGSFDPSAVRVYIDGKQSKQKDLGARSYSARGKAGTHEVVISGPAIKPVHTSLTVKPLLGGKQTIAVQPADTAKDIVAKNLTLKPGETLDIVQLFGSEWIGVRSNNPNYDYPTAYALKYNYPKGAWVVVNPDSHIDTSQAIFKDAPPDLITFLTDTAGD